ncbi:hypothetical protein DY470_13205 [Bacillus anthracis]|nr:hypothetical protein DY470_13205 [Bacillus anthracis]
MLRIVVTERLMANVFPTTIRVNGVKVFPAQLHTLWVFFVPSNYIIKNILSQITQTSILSYSENT